MSANSFGFNSAMSMAAAGLQEKPTQEQLEFELSWHYSTTLFAEEFGEMVLQDILSAAPQSKRITALLNSQLHDEAEHSRLYQRAIQISGFQSSAGGYAQAYSKLVTSEHSFCRKVFIFQVLTETVAKSFAEWRLKAIEHEELNKIDRTVLSDEIRHLGFAEPLLFRCDIEQLKEEMDLEALRRLSQSMILACKKHMDDDFKLHVNDISPVQKDRRRHELDMIMPRQIISATRKISEFVERRTRIIA